MALELLGVVNLEFNCYEWGGFPYISYTVAYELYKITTQADKLSLRLTQWIMKYCYLNSTTMIFKVSQITVLNQTFLITNNLFL